MPERTSSRTESAALAALRALRAPGFPAWSPEPLHEVLATKLGVAPRAAREALAALDVRAVLSPSVLGRVDETWLYRTRARAARGIAGVVGIVELHAPLALVRTIARDAVDRERILRALHATLGERPAHELARPVAPVRKLTREDARIARVLRSSPYAAVDTLAAQTRLPARAVKERAAKLAADGAIALDVRPREEALFHVMLRLAPSSTAAGRRALDAIPGLVEAWLPAAGEAAVCDALVWGAPDLVAAREVPGVASVEAHAIVDAWRDDEAIDALFV